MVPPHVGHALNMQPQVPHVDQAPNMHSQVPDINIGISSLSYEELQLGNPYLWDGCTNLIFMFSQTATQEINVNNIKISLCCISDFTRNRELKNNREEDIPFLKGFGQIAFDFVFSIFKSR